MCLYKNLLLSLAAVMLFADATYAQVQRIGIFDGQSDVEPVKLKGNAVYDAKARQYVVSGSGADVFFTSDELHLLWKKVKGDFTLRANAAFIGGDTHMYGKFGLMARKTLAGDAAQVNVVVHGNQLTALQWRKGAADSTYEQRTTVLTADVLELSRKGEIYTMRVSHQGQPFGPAKSIRLNLGLTPYVGLFICSHVPGAIKKAMFSNVQLANKSR